MKIALLNIYNGKIERGSEIFVDNLAKKLSYNHKVTVFQTGNKNVTGYKTVQITGIPFLQIKNRLQEEIYHLLVLFFTVKCLAYLWEEKFDWIVPINGRWQVLLCRLFRLLHGGKILISGHAGVGFDDRWNLILGKPDIFVALSQKALSWAKNIYPKEKLVYIPNGIDTEKFNPKILPAKLSLSGPIILCVSALLSYKRLDLLVVAVSKLKSASLLIIGDGSLKARILKMGNELLGKRFQLIPYVPHEEISAYYNASALFSLPSRESEAFGLVYLEALACNLAVVAPDDINRREIIGNAGLLGDLESKEVYAKLLEKALNTDFADKPQLQAAKFSWNKIASRYEEILKQQ